MDSEATDGQADLLASSQLLAGDFREATRIVGKIRAVTSADVQAFAKKSIRNLQTFGVGNVEAIGKGAPAAP